MACKATLTRLPLNPFSMELSRKERPIVCGDPGLAVFSEHHDHTRHIEDTD